MLILNEKNEIGIDNTGFVEASDYNTAIAKCYRMEFELLDQINQYMYDLYDALEPKRDDLLGCFFIGTYNKIHKNIQAAMVLATRGLNEQIKILIRSNLDKLMVMQAISNNHNNYNLLVEHHKNETYRLINAIKRGEPGLEHLANQIPKDKEFEKGKKTSQIEWAKMAGMEDDYNVVYRLFSRNIHHALSSLEDEFVFEDGLPSIMDIGPQYEDSRQLLATLATDALRCAHIIEDYFGINSKTYNELDNKLEIIKNAILQDVGLL